jgi:hypothetical protein
MIRRDFPLKAWLTAGDYALVSANSQPYPQQNLRPTHRCMLASRTHYASAV